MSTLESLERSEQLEKWIDENIEWITLIYDLHKQKREHDEKESAGTVTNRQPNCS
jgi:hypothetical protein